MSTEAKYGAANIDWRRVNLDRACIDLEHAHELVRAVNSDSRFVLDALEDIQRARNRLISELVRRTDAAMSTAV